MKPTLRLLIAVLLVSTAASAQSSNPDYSDVVQYIAKAWDVLSRSMDNCETVVDPKMPTQSMLYVPAEYPINDRLKQLESRCKVKVVPLPERITRPGQLDVTTLHGHGLLLLENPYVEICRDGGNAR